MKLIAIFLLFYISLQAFANEPMTWEACARYALDHNLSLKQQSNQLKGQALKMAYARQRYLPAVNAYANYTENFGRSIDPQTNAVSNTEFYAANYGVKASLGLFEGFTRQQRVRYEKMMVQCEEASLERRRKQLIFDVIEQFSKVKLYEGIVKIAEDQVSLSQRFSDRYTKLIVVGQKSQLSIVDIQAQLAQDSVKLVRAQMALDLQMNNLRELLNYPLGKILLIKNINFIPYRKVNDEYSSEQLIAIAAQHLPEIEELQKRLDASQVLIHEEQGRLLPSLSLNSGLSSAFYETTKNTRGGTMSLSNQYDGNLGSYLSLNLSIPIFNRLHTRNRVQSAKLEYENQHVYYEEAMQGIRYELNENYLLLNAALQSFKYGLSSEEKQKIAFTTAEKRLENGLINILDYYLYKNAYAFAKSERIRLGLELFLQQKIIDYYLTGTILE